MNDITRLVSIDYYTNSNWCHKSLLEIFSPYS